MLGEPNCGKTWFIKAITQTLLTVGYINKFNRNYTFNFEQLQYCKAIHIDEPDLGAEHNEELKLLCGGDSIMIQRKGKSAALLQRAPIFITANTYIFPDEDAWQQRVTLKHVKNPTTVIPNWETTKPANPIAVYRIFQDYGLLK